MESKPCIIFDMDGTLIDSSEAMTFSVNFVRNALGLDPIEKSFLEYHINQPDQHLSKIFYNTLEYDPAHKELFKQSYITVSATMTSLYPDVKEMLEALSQKAILSIATNASDFFAYNMLEHHEINTYFSHVLGANNVTTPKPDAEMLETIIKASHSKKEQTIMVGDSIKDEWSAKNAGVEFVFADWGYGKSQTASMKAKDIKELQTLIDFLQNAKTHF